MTPSPTPDPIPRRPTRGPLRTLVLCMNNGFGCIEPNCNLCADRFDDQPMAPQPWGPHTTLRTVQEPSQTTAALVDTYTAAALCVPYTEAQHPATPAGTQLPIQSMADVHIDEDGNAVMVCPVCDTTGVHVNGTPDTMLVSDERHRTPITVPNINGAVSMPRTLRCNVCMDRCDACGDSPRPLPGRGVRLLEGGEQRMCENCCSLCPDCGDRVDNDEMTTAEGDTLALCEDCTRACENCGETLNAFERSSGHVYDGEPYCETCFDEEYTQCECGTVYENENGCYDEASGEYSCERCHGHTRADGRAIHDYTYRPRFVFARTASERSTRPVYFGVELEVDDGSDCESTAASFVDTMGAFYFCKYDGSLNAGFEMVSHPGTLAHFNTLADALEPAYKAIARAGFRSYNVDTTGMHVHIARDTMSPLHQYKLLRFIRDNAEHVFSVSRRKRSAFDQWAGIANDSSAEIANKAKGSVDAQRYRSANVTRSTIEIRIFRGTLRAASYLRNIDLCAAWVEYTRNAALGALTAAHFTWWLHTPAARAVLPGASLKRLRVWDRLKAPARDPRATAAAAAVDEAGVLVANAITCDTSIQHTTRALVEAVDRVRHRVNVFRDDAFGNIDITPSWGPSGFVAPAPHDHPWVMPAFNIELDD